ncbi:hypothetical protein [Peribacillus asahii]|uniref:hypothetical protein n=1 Tax=Peribacillus asahii TaxID=228899 RepID=UPI00207932CB|nr:hypothetical protein [Peribacillus asahii]USK70484.1 hypothetical protein LIS76_01065 [Peribacillus asahii]
METADSLMVEGVMNVFKHPKEMSIKRGICYAGRPVFCGDLEVSLLKEVEKESF